MANISPPEYDRVRVDPMFDFVAASRFQQKIAKEVIEGTLRKDEEFQQQARATLFEQNFSRVNLETNPGRINFLA